ncbi:MAG TPA: hypothetical protein VJ783_12785 [Pirellulales bacterium]|nr:hypothetical protein [Pirellulales bacterium]
MYRRPPHRRHSFLYEHSLSLATTLILAAWIILYSLSSPATHWGSFFGNAVADWSGVLVMVIATKYLYEKGSAESRQPRPRAMPPHESWLRDHSLGIFLLITGIGWLIAYIHMNSEARWGQVVGNIVSEWTQIFGVLFMTKKLRERHSKAA